MHTEFTENEEDELAAPFLATMHTEFIENEEDELAATFKPGANFVTSLEKTTPSHKCCENGLILGLRSSH